MLAKQQAARQGNPAKAWAVVKADAYGHGLLRVARALDEVADGFALLEMDAAVALREAGFRQPILLLEGVFDALREQGSEQWPSVRLATFGDTQLLDFLPLRVNAMSQQHERIAERVLAWTLQAVENNDYSPGIEAIERSFKARL